MHTEPSQELDTGKSCCLLLSMVPVIFQCKFNMLIIYTNKTMIGNGYPVSILTKITHHMFCITKGRFAVNDPWFVPCLFYLRQILQADFFSDKRLLSPAINKPRNFKLNCTTGKRYLPPFPMFLNLPLKV